jgi:hypothetical protein
MKATGTDARGFRLLLAVLAAVQFQGLGAYFQSNADKQILLSFFLSAFICVHRRPVLDLLFTDWPLESLIRAHAGEAGSRRL